MSSDTFSIEVRAVEGDTVEFLCTTSTAGGVNDYALTRSFALMLLQDGMAADTPLQQALDEIGGGSTPPIWEESFHREHVGKFLASTELVERIGIVGDERAWSEGRHADGEAGDPNRYRDYPLHRFVLRARVTDPRWLEGLSAGTRFGTTAYDAWWDDPTRPSKREMDAVTARASRWQPPGTTQAAEPAADGAKRGAAKRTAKKTAGKKSAKKTAGKKTAKQSTAKAGKKTASRTPAKQAGKKTAAKKTAAKKTAAKKTAGKKTASKRTGGETSARKTPGKRASGKKAAKKRAS